MKRPDVRIIREPYTGPPAESLRYTLDVYDERDNLVETIGRWLISLSRKLPCAPRSRSTRASAIFLRERARVIKRYDELD